MEMQVRGPNHLPTETIYSTIVFPIKEKFLQTEIQKAWEYGQKHKIDVCCLILNHNAWKNKDIEKFFISIKKAIGLNSHYSIKRIPKNKKSLVLNLFSKELKDHEK